MCMFVDALVYMYNFLCINQVCVLIGFIAKLTKISIK